MSKGQTYLLVAILAPLGFALFVWVAGRVVMGLWNWLLPGLFGLPAVTFWQALGLLALSRILFGGFGFGGGGGYYRPPRKHCERFKKGVGPVVGRLSGEQGAPPSTAPEASGD